MSHTDIIDHPSGGVESIAMAPEIAWGSGSPDSEIAKVVTSVTQVCRPILEILIIRIILKFGGPITKIAPPMFRALVASRVSRKEAESSPFSSYEAHIKGVARHPYLHRDGVRFQLNVGLIDTPTFRFFSRTVGALTYTYLGKSHACQLEASNRGTLQLRPLRANGEPGSVRFNKYGSMMVRRSDYD